MSWIIGTIHLPMLSIGRIDATFDAIFTEKRYALTPTLPGMPTSHSMRFIEPSLALDGFAKKPWKRVNFESP